MSRAQVAGVVFGAGFQNADVDRFIKIHQVIDSSRATYFCVSHEAIDSRKRVKKKKKRGKKEKEKKEGKKEFKEVLKSRDLDNVFEIQVGGKMRIF